LTIQEAHPDHSVSSHELLIYVKDRFPSQICEQNLPSALSYASYPICQCQAIPAAIYRRRIVSSLLRVEWIPVLQFMSTGFRRWPRAHRNYLVAGARKHIKEGNPICPDLPIALKFT